MPEETRRVAQAAFPKGTLCLHIADALGPIYQDSQFKALFPRRGQPAEAPGRLALAVVLQFVENLSGRETADAVRGRIDGKYALGLARSDPGFDHTVLSEFRTRLAAGGAELLLLDTLLQRLQEQGLVKARGRQRKDSTHVLAAVRVLNRLERVGETLRAALNELAAVAPEWLQAREHFEALQGARKHQETTAFRASYAARAGIEGTYAQAISRCGLRRSRYVGLAKTHLQHVITATVCEFDTSTGTGAGHRRGSDLGSGATTGSMHR